MSHYFLRIKIIVYVNEGLVMQNQSVERILSLGCVTSNPRAARSVILLCPATKGHKHQSQNSLQQTLLLSHDDDPNVWDDPGAHTHSQE
jgi:hypothetical protein